MRRPAMTPPEQTPKVSIVINTRDQARLTAQILESVFQQRFRDLEVIIVDVGSTDDSFEVYARYPVKVLRYEGRELNYAKAVNLGIRQARGEYVVRLSGDAIPADESWLENLIAPLEADAQVAGVFSRWLNPSWNRNRFDALYAALCFRDQRRESTDSPTWLGTSGSLRRSLFELHPFDETMRYCEDIDWSAQAQAAGYKIVYEPASKVYHVHGYGLASFISRNLQILWYMSKIEIRQMTGYYRRRASGRPGQAGAMPRPAPRMSSDSLYLSLALLMLCAAASLVACVVGVLWVLAAVLLLLLPAAAYYCCCLLKLRRLSSAGLEETADFIFGPGSPLVGALQHRGEIIPFLKECFPQPPSAVAEIGRGRGGTLALLCRAAAPDALVVSLDLPGGCNSGTIPGLTRGALHRPLLKAMSGPRQDLRLIDGDSRSPAARALFEAALAGRKLDLLFIDGDHSFEGVRSDFELYAGFVKPGGIVAFHDIQPGYEESGVEVERFWRETALPGSRQEYIADRSQASRGIGVLRLRADRS